MKKALNNENEFAYEEKDNDQERNAKDTKKLIFSPERFLMSRMYHTEDLSVLTNYEKLTQFVKSSTIGELPLYWESAKVPRSYYSQKIVGEDFDRRVLDSKKDAFILVYHPSKEKNRGIISSFENFVRTEQTVNGVS